MLTVTIIISVMTYHKKPPPINSDALSMTWSCEVTWEIKHIISTPAEDP